MLACHNLVFVVYSSLPLLSYKDNSVFGRLEVKEGQSLSKTFHVEPVNSYGY